MVEDTVDNCLPLQYQYRYSNNCLEAWKTVDLNRKTKGSPPDLGRITLPPLYAGPRSINKKKLDDLLELLQSVHHSFYTQLKGAGDDSESESDSSDGKTDVPTKTKMCSVTVQ